MTCMLCDTNHRDPQDHPHTTTTEALCKYIREREAAAVAAAREEAARLCESLMTANHGIEDCHEEDAKAIRALTSSDAAAALARRDAETRLKAKREAFGYILANVTSQATWYTLVTDAIRDIDAHTRQLDEAKAPKEGR